MRADGEQECPECSGLSGDRLPFLDFLGPGDQTSLVEIYGRSQEGSPEVLLARVLVSGWEARAALRRVTLEEADGYWKDQEERIEGRQA